MDLSEFESSNIRSCIVESTVPSITTEEPCCLGIDEAGRGPVLGPMVYGICYCPISLKEKLSELGFADSKVLSEEAREKLFTVIDQNKDFIGWMLDILSPTQISNDMLKRSKYSLNAISHDSAIGLVKQAISKGVQVKELFVDTVGPAEKYQEKLSGIFPDIEVTVTPKADSKFPCVSAASICAKVGRDNVVKSWKFNEGEFSSEYGSGYPNDPMTKKWLKEELDPIFGYPQLVRFSWSTAADILQKNAKAIKWDDDDENDEITEAAKGTAPITSFFIQKVGEKKTQRHKFFQERHLEQVVEF